MTTPNNPQTPEIDESIFEGVSPEVADKYRAELGLAKPADPAPSAVPVNNEPAPADNETTPAAAAASPVPPAVKGVEATPGEPSLEEQLAKEYPNGSVPISALIAERKKRQELEKLSKATPAPAIPTQQPSLVQPIPQQVVQPQPAAVPAPVPVDSKRVVQEAIGLWEEKNSGQVFDPVNPVHMAELMDYKAQVQTAYEQHHQREAAAQQETLRQQHMQQRYQAEVVGALHTTYGVEFAAIDKFAGELLAADQREQYYVFGSLMQGNFQPMHEFYAKAAEKYREATAPKPVVKTEAEKLAEIEALPRTIHMNAAPNGGSKTDADIERMIMDGTWRTLPEKEREAIIARMG